LTSPLDTTTFTKPDASAAFPTQLATAPRSAFRTVLDVMLSRAVVPKGFTAKTKFLTHKAPKHCGH
jgi:hypothetical protein